MPNNISHPDTIKCGPACMSAPAHTNHHLTFGQQVQEFFTGLFATDDWPARWHCGTWTDFHGWLYLLSDVGIWAAYFAIPLLLIRLLVKRRDIPFNKIFGLFIAFIMLCGLTHFFDAVGFWWPAYRFSALLRFATAMVSIITVYALYKVMPIILQLRTVTELEAEIEKRKIIEEKLAASEFLLSEAGRIGRVGGWEFDIVLRKSTWSKTIYDILELPYDYDIETQDITRKFLEPYNQQIRNAVDKAYADGSSWDLELLLNKQNSPAIWVRSIGEPLYDDDGKLIKLRGVFMDIDRYKGNEMALNKSLELITQNNQQLKNFTHILSHNIRNHASNISLISSLVEVDMLDSNNADLIAKIKNISVGLNATLNDLAEAIKIKDDIIQPEELVFSEVTAKVLEVIDLDIKAGKAEITTNYTIPTVKFPAIYLESTILNLVSNAVKYRNPNITPRIQLSTYKTTNGHTVFECRDNGIGIDLKLHGEKIFGLYKTFHNRNDARGVGLFLVKTQIDSQGGKIEVESSPGEGSVFKIIFNE